MIYLLGFPTGVENMRGEGGGGGGALQNLMRGGLIHGESMGELKMLSKNTCERVHLIVKLPAISLQSHKCTKMNFFTHIFQGF